MKKTIRAYDLWDFPESEQTKIPASPPPKVKKKPGPKPKVVAPMPVEISQRGEDFPIKQLIDGIRKLLIEVDVRDPKPKIIIPNKKPVSYISNIVLDGKRIGLFEQPVDGKRVYLKFDKGQNIPIWHEGDGPEVMADKIKEEIEKHYTKKLAAKLARLSQRG